MSLAVAALVGFATAVVGLSLVGLKWSLRMAVVLPWSLGVSAAVGVLSCALGRGLGLAVWYAAWIVPVVAGVASAATLAWRFFRDPERVPPAREGVVLSPADGKVIYVRELARGAAAVSEKKGSSFRVSELVPAGLLGETGWLIGISMSYLDVHVNRAPIAGTVTRVLHVPGRFLSLRKPEAVFANERMLTVVDGGRLKAAVVQIASRLVRRIVGYVPEGAVVGLGQRIGKITLGSQVDLIVTGELHLRVRVQPGQHVSAGQTIVATAGEFAAGRTAQKGAIS